MLRVVAGGVTLSVRAQPGAKKTGITGIYGEGAAAQLKIVPCIRAPNLGGTMAEFTLPAPRRHALPGRLS